MNNNREKIIDVLKNNPQGLTILELAKLAGMNRITISRYVYGLECGGLVSLRCIGNGKLYTLV